MRVLVQRVEIVYNVYVITIRQDLETLNNA